MEPKQQKEQQRGVFPGLKFFTTLSDLAVKTTTEIKNMNHELQQPSSTHTLQGDIWNSLHKEYNKAYNKSIGLQELLKQPSISESMDAYHSMLKWIIIETNRIEKQLKQYGFKPDNNTNYTYNLPLNKEQQIEYNNKQKEIEKLKQKQKQNNMDIDINNNSNNDRNNNNNNNINDNDNKNNDMDIDDDHDSDNDIDIDEKHDQNNQNTDPIANKNKQSNSPKHQNNPIANIQQIQLTPHVTKKAPVIQTTPKTPGLEDHGYSNSAFNYLLKSIKNDNININKSKMKPLNTSNPISHSVTSTTSALTETVTPSMSGSRILQTPQYQFKSNMNYKNNINLNDSILSNELSTPKLPSPININNKYSFNRNDNNNTNNNILQPITPFNASQYKTQPKNNATPITVSSFAVKKSNEDELMDDMNGYGMRHITQEELNKIATFIRSQLGDLNNINSNINLINKALKKFNGRITKTQFGEILQNETAFILLLTKTNRLQSEWTNNTAIYSLIT